MKWVVAVLLAVSGSWMAFDGARALMIGEYITPNNGRYAGELGPWSKLVERVGIPARSTAMKMTFVVVGVVQLSAAFLLVVSDGAASRWFALMASLMSLWYLPFGTVANGIALALLLTSLRPW